MKTKIYLLLVLCLGIFSSFGQNCINNVQIGVAPLGGDLTLSVSSFLENADASVTYSLTPSTIGCDDVGTVSVTVEGSDGFTCNSTLTVVDNIAPIAVVDSGITLALNENGNATIIAENIDDGSYDSCTDITLSLSQTQFNCDDIGDNLITLTVTDAYGNTNEGVTTVTVVDNIPPVVYANNYVNVSFDQNGEVHVTVDMVEEGIGTPDNCGEITKTVFPSFFDCNDAGEQNVILTATDEAGNVSTVVSVLNLEDKIAPIPVVVNLSTALLSTGPGDLFPTVKVYAEDFDLGSYDNCEIVDMTINRDVFTCEDIGENEVVFTVYDAAGNSNSAVLLVDIVDNTTTANSVACNTGVVYSSFQDLPFTLTPYDVLEGGPYGCNFIFYLEVKDENGDLVPNNLVTSDYLGQTLTYSLFDWNSSNTCFGTIIISDEDPGCDFDGEEDINWPLPLIELDLLNVDASDVTPEYIGNQADYTYADAFPSIALDSCSLIGINYEDIVIPSGLFSYKILRQFTVVDWINYNVDTQEGVYGFDQVIKNNNYPAWYICDTLPRSAPLGDCDSGHTFDDDVEWPNDITIADHRITPTELINYSGIEIEDAEPQFYGEDAEFYSLSYQDLVGSLETDLLCIDRVWTVTHFDIPGLDFTYTQKLCVSFTQFSSLVAVNTHGDRAVPEVALGNNILTDNFGKATVEDDFFITPELNTSPLNGVDLVDLYLAREHILGRIELNDYQLIAGEYTDAEQFSTLDLVRLQRTIIGLDQDNADWQFIDVTEDLEGINQVRGHYIAYKQGDIDDSALLPGQTANSLDQVEVSYEDQILNSGESYIIPFSSEAMINASGIEFRIKYDPSIIDIIGVTSDMFGTDVVWTADAGSEVLTILAYDIDEAYLLDGNTPLFEISATAKMNSVLNLGLDISSTDRSFIIDENLTKFGINGTIENGIGLGTNNGDFASAISIYPNPAVDIINIDISKTDIVSDYIITLYDANGNQVATQTNHEQIATHNLPTGSYIILLTSGDSYYSELIQIYK